MERDELEQLVAEGLTLSQIGERLGLHPSTVSYWLKKHDLRPANRAKYARRGGLSREALEGLVDRDLTLSEMARELSVSITTVRYWLLKHDLRRVRRRGPRSQVAKAAKAARLLAVSMECPRHGHTDFVLEGRGYYRCRRCRQERVSEWRRRVKLALISEAGGSCRVCGYDRCPAALQFHHLQPSTKAFALSREGATRSFEEARAEARKCVLLCANCHAEVESGHRTLAMRDTCGLSHEAPPGGLEPP